MRRTPLSSVFILVFTLCAESMFSEESADIPSGLLILRHAYPGSVLSIEANALVLADGTRLPYNTGGGPAAFEELLDRASLSDQMSQRYTAGARYDRSVKDFDPGRIRNEAFFRAMYGSTAAEVQKRLVTVRWLPGSVNIPLRVTKVNGVSRALEKISAEIERRPHLLPYADKPAGTYYWRTIRGTGRLSMHSFGIAIDLNPEHSDYWLDDLDKGKAPGEFKNRMPLELVEIFERHGFIWGGKWYHYDTMHFEYRPELLAGDG